MLRLEYRPMPISAGPHLTGYRSQLRILSPMTNDNDDKMINITIIHQRQVTHIKII